MCRALRKRRSDGGFFLKAWIWATSDGRHQARYNPLVRSFLVWIALIYRQYLVFCFSFLVSHLCVCDSIWRQQHLCVLHQRAHTIVFTGKIAPSPAHSTSAFGPPSPISFGSTAHKHRGSRNLRPRVGGRLFLGWNPTTNYTRKRVRSRFRNWGRIVMFQFSPPPISFYGFILRHVLGTGVKLKSMWI
ncbi:hypothetical protein DFH07DRAFT_842195, partial [Mycena maculata]